MKTRGSLSELIFLIEEAPEGGFTARALGESIFTEADGVANLHDKVRDAVARYPYPREYRAWPGPNSNTFMAFLGREVPELGLALPANAIGKDFLPGGAIAAMAPSGSGFQLSAFGVAGILLAVREGLEFNVLGLNIGIDIANPALKLPGIGRLGMSAVIVD